MKDIGDILIFILTIPPAILSLIELAQVVQKYSKIIFRKKFAIDKEELSYNEIHGGMPWHKKPEISFIFYILYIILITLVGLNVANSRSEKIIEGYKISEIRNELEELKDEVNFIRSENSLILSDKVEKYINELRSMSSQ